MRLRIVIPFFFVGLIITAIVALSQRPAANGQATAEAERLRLAAVATQEAAQAVLPTPTPIPPPTPTRIPIPPEIAAQMDEIEKGAADLRGLEPMDDVEENFMPRAVFREQYKREMQETVSMDKVRDYLHELWLLRLVADPSIDFYDVSADLGSDGILGYYDHRNKQLYVITDKTKLTPEDQVTLAHEYVHFLQDEHYKLRKIWPTEATDRDKSMAIRSLVEGDATLSGYAWAANYMSGRDFRSLFEEKTLSKDVAVRTPPYLGMSTIFPYVQGTNFVAELLRVARFSTVNLALQDPPRSTEQIMHPEKFLQTPADQPKAVGLPDLLVPLGEGWEMKESNTLGEFDMNVMLRENGAGDPDKGADGWGGCKFAYYRLAHEGMVYAASTWDTLDDASQFTGAMTESFAKAQKDGEFYVDNGRTFWIHQKGKRVVFISSTNRPALDRVVAAEAK
jgi:hypothetical protein